MSAGGIQSDNTEPLSRSFKGRWIGATLEEMRVIGEAAFDNQEMLKMTELQRLEG